MFKTIFTIALFLIFGSVFVYAQTTPTPTPKPNSSNTQELGNKIAEYESKIAELKSQENSLSSQIGVMDNQIKLTEARMDATKAEIMELTLDIDSATKRVDKLEASLDDISEVLVNRIIATYKAGDVGPLHILAAAGDVDNLFTKSTYLKLVQEHDKKLMYNAQQAKNDYANQKNIFEDKKAKIEGLQTQLEEYNTQLDKERENKENLLEQTKGSEERYQALLAEAKAEYLAVQGVISGQGTEGKIGHVNQGDAIASIIQGASCNSTGTHLHFTVLRGGGTENPFNHLKDTGHNSYTNDPWTASGSWDWPLSGTIEYYQGYGNTGFAAISGIYSFHNGIDVYGSAVVRAVKSGTLYQGSYTGGGGCRLRYVRVDHDEGDLDTLYLHVNYVN